MACEIDRVRGAGLDLLLKRKIAHTSFTDANHGNVISTSVRFDGMGRLQCGTARVSSPGLTAGVDVGLRDAVAASTVGLVVGLVTAVGLALPCAAAGAWPQALMVNSAMSRPARFMLCLTQSTV